MQQFGDLLMAALELTQKPREGVQTAIGAVPGLDGLANGPGGALERGRMRTGEIASGAAATGGLGPALQTLAIVGNLFPQVGQHTKPMMGDVLADPLNAFGMGLPGKGAQAIRAGSHAGQMAPEALARTLDLMQYLESGFGKSVAAVMRQPFVGNTIPANVPGIGGKRVPISAADLLGRKETAPLVQGAKVWEPEMIPQDLPGIDDFFIQGQRARTPETILDFIKSTHAQSIVKHRDTDLADAVRMAQAGGANLEDALAEMTLAKDLFLPAAKKEIMRGGKKVQTLDYDANLTRLHQVEDGVWDAMNKMSDPRAKLSGIEILGQAQERVMTMWYDELIKLERAGGPSTGGTALNRWNDFYEKGYERSQEIFQSAQRAMRRVEGEVGKLPALDPAAAKQYDALWQYNKSIMGGIRTAPAYPEMGLLPTPGGGGLWDSRVPGLRAQNIDTLQNSLFPQRQALEQAIGGARASYSKYPQGMVDQLLDPETANKLMSQAEGQVNMVKMGLPGFMADLPSYYRNILFQHIQDFAKYGQDVVGSPKPRQGDLSAGARGLFERGLKELFEARMPGQKYTPMPIGVSGPSIIEHFNKTIRSMDPEMTVRLDAMFGPQGVQSAGDFYEFTSGLLPKTGMHTALRKKMAEFPGGDILTSDVFDLTRDRVVRGLAANLGIAEKPGPLGETYGGLMNLWKESAILAPAYDVVNTLGGLFMGGLEGVNPGRVSTSLIKNMKAILQSGPQTDITPGHIGALLERMELPGVPQSATAQSAALLRDDTWGTARELAGVGIPQSQRIGPGWLSLAGAIGGGASGVSRTSQDASPQEKAAMGVAGAAIGGGLGAAFPSLSGKHSDIIRGIENVLRKEGWFEGFRRSVQDFTPDLKTIVQDAMNEVPETIIARSGGKQKIIVPTPVPPQTQKAVLDIIDQEQGMLGPSMVEGLLKQAGVRPEVARDAARQWEGLRDLASQQGVALSHSFNFDYSNLNNAEYAMRSVVPFSTWATKALPFFTRHMAEDPWLPMTMARIQAESGEQKEKRGLPARFAGAVEANPMSGVWSALTGRNVTPFFNPTRGLFPFSDAARSFEGSPNESPLEFAQRAGGLIGFSGFGPIIDTALRVASPLVFPEAADEPARGPIRQAGPIQALTGAIGLNRGAGIDLNASLITAEETLRKGIGQEPLNTERAAIQKRLDEMALERTGLISGSGKPQVAEYVTAKETGQGKLWDEARALVQRERAPIQASSFALGGLFTPQALLSDTEASIRQARVDASPKETQRVFREIAEATNRNPQQRLPEQAKAVREMAVRLSQPLYDEGILQPGELSPRLEGWLADPTAVNLNEARQSIMKQLEFQNPLMQGYGQTGSGEQGRLQTLLSNYNNIASLIKRDPANAKMSEEDVAHLARLYEQTQTMSAWAKQTLTKGNDPLARQLKYIQTQRDAFRKAPGNDVLDEYLNFQAQQRGTGTIENFFRARKRGS